MQNKNSKKLWSLKIPINISKTNKEIKEYLLICEEKLGIVPNILKTNTIDKKKFDTFNIFYNRLMQDENFLKKEEKEMIAVVVSSLNRCLYCCVSHSYTLGKLLNDTILAKKILINYKSAGLNKKNEKMLDFVKKLTVSSYSIDETDRNKLRKENFTEHHILEIIEVCSFFNMTNRLASGTNMQPNEEYYLTQ